MTKVDLITGFLGAGKTAFLRRYMAWMKNRGLRIYVIENEFGSASVDRIFLDETAENIGDLSGCCMSCGGRRVFRRMLVDAANAGYDRILVEPSGVYDVEEFFSIMDSSEVSAVCEIGSIITIADAVMPCGLTENTEYLLYTQLAAAGIVLISKVQTQTPEMIEETRAALREIVEKRGGQLSKERILIRQWNSLTDEAFVCIANAGYRQAMRAEEKPIEEEIYESVMLMEYCRDEGDLQQRLRRLYENTGYGSIVRIKGFIRDLTGEWYAVNSTPGNTEIEKTVITRGILVVIGRHLQEEKLRTEAFLPAPAKKQKNGK